MSQVESRPVNRRQILTGLALFGAGAAGGGAAMARADAPAAMPTRSRQTLTLRSKQLMSKVPGRVPGELRPANQPASTHGEVVDDGGADVGTFSSAAVPGSAGALMLHTFDLAGGTILGMGAGPLAGATYAVVGGTGRYQGVTGSYVARQHPRDLGGDGTAVFVLDLTTEGS